MGNQTSLINSITLPEFTDLTQKEFAFVNQTVKSDARQLFISDTLGAHTGDSMRYDEVDVETFASNKPEGSDAVKAQMGVGYNKTMTLKRIAKEIDITWEMRTRNKKPQIMGQVIALTGFCSNRIELDLTHRLTFCSSTSYADMDGETVSLTVGDGYQVAYATHTLPFSGSTYRNRVANDPPVSQGALEVAEALTVTNVLNNFGDRRVMNFNTIVTGDDPTTVRTVKQILNSTADIDGSHAGVLNTYKGAYNHVILPYLATTATSAHDSTKKRWWFLIAAGQGVNGWQAYFATEEAPNLKTPTAGNNGEDIHNDNWTYGVRASYGIVVASGRGLVASLPTS